MMKTILVAALLAALLAACGGAPAAEPTAFTPADSISQLFAGVPFDCQTIEGSASYACTGTVSDRTDIQIASREAGLDPVPAGQIAARYPDMDRGCRSVPGFETAAVFGGENAAGFAALVIFYRLDGTDVCVQVTP
ncbi:MAG: hypothetical protein GYB64_15395 [Chloroflexi bacterium]|nr:hypothetical protein [Chloroflexota bacterium]